MKKQRQARILEILADREIHTQEQITAVLKEEGFKVTQATVSRDLKDLKLSKNMTHGGVYKSVSERSPIHIGTLKLNSALADSIADVKYSMNNVVIKTLPGLAQAVASGVDSLDSKDVLGCVAGDDTIIVVTVDEESAEQLCADLSGFIKTY